MTLPKTLETRVGTGDIDASGSKIRGVLTGTPETWNAEVMQRVLEYGFGRVHGVLLNDVPVDGGEKYRAAKEMIEAMNRGETPDWFVRTRSTKAAKSPGDEALAQVVQEVIDALIAQLRPLAEKAKFTGSGKNGRVLAKDWPRFAAKVKAVAHLVHKDEWNMDALIRHAKEKKADRLAEVRQEIEDRAALLESVDVDLDLDTVELDF
jgi:hypothetical protein